MKLNYVLLLLLGLSGIVELNAQADLDTLRDRVIERLLRPSIDAYDVQQYQSTLQKEGCWPDINYQDTSRTGFQYADHLDRMVRMAHALKKPTSLLFEDEHLKKDIHRALDYWLIHDFICENWWWNQIGTPNLMVQLFLLMDDDLRPDQILQAAPIFKRATLNAWGARPGGDRMKIGSIYGRVALFNRDVSVLNEVVTDMVHEIRISRGRGLQADMGFHHRKDRVTSTLSYGKSYAAAFAEWAELLQRTNYAFPDQTLELLIDSIL